MLTEILAWGWTRRLDLSLKDSRFSIEFLDTASIICEAKEGKLLSHIYVIQKKRKQLTKGPGEFFIVYTAIPVSIEEGQESHDIIPTHLHAKFF